MFWGMGNHLGSFSGALEVSEGHEQAAGGQGALHGVTRMAKIVTQLLAMLDT